MTDIEWAIVAPLVPEPKTNGRQATIARRELRNAMFYVTKTGCGWEWLPHDLPKWKTVYAISDFGACWVYGKPSTAHQEGRS